MKRSFILLLGAALAGGLLAGPVAQAQQNDRRDNASESGPAYLGLAVESMPAALTAHLRQAIGEDRGVLVVEVAPGSPAEKAGLRPHDVVISIDDQRIYSPEQFVKIVRNERPGREATLQVAHNGQVETVRVKLGTRPESETAWQRHRTFRVPQNEQNGQTARNEQNNQNESRTGRREAGPWDLFDAMSLSRTGKNQFKAEIKFRDDQGKVDSRHFEGSLDQIRKDVEQQRDLPKAERQHLLDALQMSANPGEAFPFGPLFRDFDRDNE